jgi:hypothetical protein
MVCLFKKRKIVFIRYDSVASSKAGTISFLLSMHFLDLDERAAGG